MEQDKKTESFVTIADLWRLCVISWRWFLASLVVCVLIAIYYLIVTPNQYTRFASVMVLEESLGKNATGSNNNEFSQIGFVNQKSNVTNVIRHITSLDVLMEVASRLQLSLEGEEVVKRALDIQSRLTAEKEDLQTTIIDLTYKDYSTAQAERVLSLIIQVYNDKWLESKKEIIKSASLFIDSRMELLERDLGEVDDSIAHFKSRYGITDLSRVSDIYLQQQSKADAELLSLTNQRAMAMYIKELLEDKSSKPHLLLVNSGISSNVIESEITHYNDLVLQLQSHLDYTSDQNPLILHQQEELAKLRSSILSNVNSHIKSLDIQLASFQDYYGETTSKIVSNPEQAKYLTGIERDQKVKEGLYMYLLQKKEENEISTSYKSVNTQVIDIPHGSDSPTSPKTMSVLFTAILLGLLIPTTLIFLRATLDETVRDRFDIERKGDIPFLGEVPLSEKTDYRLSLQRKLGLATQRSTIVVGHGKQDPANEAFRMIRTKIDAMTSSHAGASKVYMVTSSQDGSGKTFVAMNLALVLAIGGRNVLFIDADLREANASKRWNAPPNGLTEYLNGRASYPTQLLYRLRDFPTLDIMSAGSIPANPTELLRSQLFERLINTMRSQYEIIIVDSPTTGLLADAEIIEKNVDRILFVIRAGQFLRSHLDDLKTPEVNRRKDKHQFVIVNGVNIDSRFYLLGNKVERAKKEKKNSKIIDNILKYITKWLQSILPASSTKK